MNISQTMHGRACRPGVVGRPLGGSPQNPAAGVLPHINEALK